MTTNKKPVEIVCAADVKLPPSGKVLSDFFNEVEEFLVTSLREGPRRQKEIAACGLARGYTKWQLRTAREKLGVIVKKSGFDLGSAWIWDFPRSYDGHSIITLKSHPLKSETHLGHLGQKPQ